VSLVSGAGIWAALALVLLGAIALTPAWDRLRAAVDLGSIDGGPRTPDPAPVALPSLPVPDMRGAGANRAQAALASAGFNSEVRASVNATQISLEQGDRWLVCEETPRPGAKALRGTMVTLVVSDRGCA
jgi:hypothetical protein